MRRHKYLIALSLPVAVCLILLSYALAGVEPSPFRLMDDSGVIHGYGRQERLVAGTIALGVYLGMLPPDPVGVPPDPCQPDTPYRVEFSVETPSGESIEVWDTVVTDGDGKAQIFLTMRLPKIRKSAPGMVKAQPPDPVGNLMSEPFTVNRKTK